MPPKTQKQRGQQQKQKKRPQGPRSMGRLQFAPTSQSIMVRPGAPTVSGKAATNDASIFVEHRELFTDINGSTAAWNLAMSQYIQPGRPEIFPWGCNLAKVYESYRLESLQFDYVPRCPTTERGFVAMAVDWDAKDPDPVNKVSLMSYHGAVSGSPWEPISLKCDTRDMHKLGRDFFVRISDASGVTGDLKTYDVGRFYIAVGGQAAASLIGEVYVTYRMRLNTPQLNTAAIAKSKTRSIHPTVGVSKANPLGTVVNMAESYGGLPFHVDTGGVGFQIEDVGTYILQSNILGTGLNNSLTIAAASAANVVTKISETFNGANTSVAQTYLLNVGQAGPDYSGGPLHFNVDTGTITTLTDLRWQIAPYAPSSAQAPGQPVRQVPLPHEE